MLIVNFLAWFEGAPAAERAEATVLLAEAYLDGCLDGADLADAEAALTLVLDDPAPPVRRALARCLAASERAPRHVIVALAQDCSSVSALVLARSPVLREADLVACIAAGDELAHVAIASRIDVTPAVAAALIARAGTDALLSLLDNPGAAVDAAGYRQIAKCHAGHAALREALHRREDLPADVRQILVGALSKDLAGFVRLTGLIAPVRAERLFCDAQDAATIGLARTAGDLGAFVAHLRGSGQLTPGLLLRGLVGGDTTLFGVALTELSGLAPRKIAGLMAARSHGPLGAVCARAGLPAAHVPAMLAALKVLRHRPLVEAEEGSGLDRAVIGAALAACLDQDEDAVRPLIAMLRRLDAEAAREQARLAAQRLRARPPTVLAAQPEGEESGVPAIDFDQVERALLASPSDAGMSIDAASSAEAPAEPAQPVFVAPAARFAPPVKTAPAEPVAAPAPAEDELQVLLRQTFAGLAEPQAPTAGEGGSWEPLRVVESQERSLDETFFSRFELRLRAA